MNSVKEGEYIGFKKKNWLDNRGHWSGRGGGLQGSWERFLGATS